MNSLHFVLLVFAFVCEFLAAISIPSGRMNLIAAGLAFYFASLIFG